MLAEWSFVGRKVDTIQWGLLFRLVQRCLVFYVCMSVFSQSKNFGSIRELNLGCM